MSFVSKRIVRSAEDDIFTLALEPRFDFQSEEYRSLHQRSHATAFQHSTWLKTLYELLLPRRGAEPVIVTVREKTTGRLMLVLPLMKSRHRGVTYLEFADFGVCDYLAAVYNPFEIEFLLADATLPDRVRAILPACDIVSLTKLNRDDPVLGRLFPQARRVQMRISAYPATLTTSWLEWRSANLDPSLLRTLNARWRRVAREGRYAFSLVTEEHEIARVFAAMRGFRSERFKDLGAHDVMDDEAVFWFYKASAVAGARDGSARTFCMYLDDKPIAVLFGLYDRQTFYFMLVGFDLRGYRRHSLGLLIVEATMRASIEAGDTVYDFTIGDHPYKLQFAAKAQPLHEWHTPQTLYGRLTMLGIDAVRETKRVLKPLLKRGPPAPASTSP